MCFVFNTVNCIGCFESEARTDELTRRNLNWTLSRVTHTPAFGTQYARSQGDDDDAADKLTGYLTWTSSRVTPTQKSKFETQ